METILKQAHPLSYLVEGATYVRKHHFDIHCQARRTPRQLDMLFLMAIRVPAVPLKGEPYQRGWPQKVTYA